MNDGVYLAHNLDAIDRINSYTASGKPGFLGNSMARDAVIRNFEIIGEATRRLSSSARASEPGIPWNQITAFRNFLIHGYFGVDLDEVWNVIERHLPALRSAIERLRTREP